MSSENDACKASLLRVSKELLRLELVEGTAGNLSARLPDGHVVMTPSSHPYDRMEIEDLVVVDLAGNIIEGERAPTSEKALHLACLRRYPDLGAVIHSHALFSSMFAVIHEPIPSVIEEFDIYVGGAVPVAKYELTGSDELGEEVANWVGDRGAVLMANHGLLTVGKDIDYALKVASLVERTAQVVWGARLMGNVISLPSATSEKFAPLYRMMGRNRITD